MTPAVILFSDAGLDTAKRAAAAIDAEIYSCGQGGADALKLLPKLSSGVTRWRMVVACSTTTALAA